MAESKAFRRQVPLFTLLGFHVRLDPSWLLLALLITWTLAGGIFPEQYPGLYRPSYWWMGLAGAMGVFFSIVLHEMSHSLAARRFGLVIRGITLFIFGGIAEMEDEPPSPGAEFVMAIAGPLASIGLSLLFFGLTQVATAAHWGTPAVAVGNYLATINLALALFNLVPAFPLDGGRVLRAALWYRRANLTSATRTASRFGGWFGGLLMIFGAVAFVRGDFIGGMWLFLIGTFLRRAAAGSYQQVLVRAILLGQPVERFMTRDAVTVSPTLTVQQLVDDYLYRYHYRMLPVTQDGQLLGCVTSEDIRPLPRADWSRCTVASLLRPCSPENTVAPDADAGRLLAAMARPGARGRYMVARGGRLQGMISLRDLLELIALRMEIDPPR